MTVIVWFRHDLRLADHAPLYHAAEDADAVVPVFIWAPEEEGDWPPGGAHRWWLHESLQSLDEDLRDKGSRLVLRAGESLAELRAVIEATGAEAVYWHERYEPALRERDEKVAEALRDDGIDVQIFPGRILHDPDEIETTSGGPYHVFTPFWRKLQSELDVAEPLPRPRLGQRRTPSSWPDSVDLDTFELTPTAQDGVDWAEQIRATWTPGEAAAHRRFEHFLDEILIDYKKERDRPDLDGTSRLSPYLHHGEISPRQVWHATQRWVQNAAMREAADKFLSEVAWREFSYHLLYHYPETPSEPLKKKFESFAWKTDDDALARWQRGQTGYPIIDAGMRQLWAIGWMHNRMRLLVASFLTKDLQLPWQDGARWFWDTLCGADLANNTMGWQWSAGSGADAQPFFRIFNPVSQGERYDPNGDFIRQWVPEIAALPDKYLNKPWEAPADVLEAAGITLGEDYPEPIVDHSAARDAALAAYNEVK